MVVIPDDNARFTKGDDSKRQKTILPGIPMPRGASEYASLRVHAEAGPEFSMGYIAPPGKGPFPAVLFLHGGLDTSKGGRGSLREGAVPTRFLETGDYQKSELHGAHATWRNQPVEYAEQGIHHSRIRIPSEADREH